MTNREVEIHMKSEATRLQNLFQLALTANMRITLDWAIPSGRNSLCISEIDIIQKEMWSLTKCDFPLYKTVV